MSSVDEKDQCMVQESARIGQRVKWPALWLVLMLVVFSGMAHGDMDPGEINFEAPAFYLDSPEAPARDLEPSAGQPAEPDGEKIDEPTESAEGQPSAGGPDGPEYPRGGAETDEPDDFDAFEGFDEFAPPEQPPVFDPLSGYNRVMTRVNDRLYYWVLKPVARGYGIVMPRPVRRGIDNFFENLGFPVRFVNNVLQGKVHSTGVETARFLINTTLGIGGLWDPAQRWMEIGPCDEDFGQTLGRYGLGGGFHVVLPVFGPSNVRDTVGRVADGFLNPVAYLEDSDTALALSIGKTVNGTSLRIGQYEAITKDAIDLYVLMRDGYEQYRIKKIEE